jgi:hypothetical protein
MSFRIEHEKPTTKETKYHEGVGPLGFPSRDFVSFVVKVSKIDPRAEVRSSQPAPKQKARLPGPDIGIEIRLA